MQVALTKRKLRVPCATLAKIEAEIRAVSDVEHFVIAHALRVPLAELYPKGLLETIREACLLSFTSVKWHGRAKRAHALRSWTGNGRKSECR